MKRNLKRLVLPILLTFVGCSPMPPAAPPTVVKGPHEGTTIRLPDDKGFVEIVNEPRLGERDDVGQTALVAYFLQPDGRSPMSPAPTDVKFDIKLAARNSAPQSVKMAADPKTSDAAGAARFASKPGTYNLVNVRGRITASIGGKEVSVDYNDVR